MSDIALFRLIDVDQQPPSTRVLLLTQEGGSVRAVAMDHLMFDETIGAYVASYADGRLAVTFSADTVFQVYPREYIESLTQGEMMEEQFAAAHAEKMFRERAQRMMGEGE